MKLLYGLLIIPVLVAADLPSADSILRQSFDRSGGAAAYAKANNAVMTGTVEMVGHNLSGPVTIYQADNRSYTSIDLPGIGKIEEGYDGHTAWEMNALQGARIKDGEEKALMERTASISPLMNWRTYYTSAKTLGAEDVDGKPAWKIEMTPKLGKPETFYFDKGTMLLVRTTATITTPLGDIPVDASMSDYRVVDGIQTPFEMTQKAMSQTLVMKFSKVQYNANIPASVFDLPPAVKALADRKK
ncbi:MAG: hypothetical protein KGN84_15265 [Acidobacteriota bacterium]|nr:hypothetical protein [Acidobacteriota bacterium]